MINLNFSNNNNNNYRQWKASLSMHCVYSTDIKSNSETSNQTATV